MPGGFLWDIYTHYTVAEVCADEENNCASTINVLLLER